MRDDLLDKVKYGISGHPDARKIVEANLSVADLTLKLARAQAIRQPLTKMLKKLPIFYAVVTILILIGLASLDTGMSQAPWYIWPILGFPLWAVGYVVAAAVLCAIRGFFADTFYIEALSPIARTSGCETALKALEEGGPDVVAWRDAAIAQRGQLYGFDVAVMTCLRDLHVHEVQEKVKAGKIEQACARVHAIA